MSILNTLLTIFGLPLVMLAGFALLGRGPRANEGRLISLLIPLLILMGLTALQAKRADVQPGNRVNLNAPELDAATLANATGVPLDLAQQVITYRNRLPGKLFRSRGQIPSLGESSGEEIRQLNAWAKAKQWDRLQGVVRTGIILPPKSASEADRWVPGRGLYPALDRQARAAALLPHPPFLPDRSSRSALVAALGNPSVVERIVQRRSLSDLPLHSLSDVTAIPLDSISLRTPGQAYGGFMGILGLLLALFLWGHLYLRHSHPDADQLLWPIFGGLAILGVIMLFAVGQPLTDRGSIWPFLGVMPEFAGQGLFIAGVMALLPVAPRLLALSEQFGQRWLFGLLAVGALFPNVLVAWGWPAVIGAAVLLALGIFFWFQSSVRKTQPEPVSVELSGKPPAETRPEVGLPVLIVGIILVGVAGLTAFRMASGRTGYAMLVEIAKVMLILFTARLCSDYEFFFGKRLSDLPMRARGELFGFWLLALLLAFLSEDLGFLLLLWIPFTLLLSLAVGHKGPALAGLIGLGLGATLLIASGHTRFPERVAAWKDPWHAPSSQMAELYQRMASVPSVATGTGIGQGTRLAVSTDTRDLILPLYYEQLGWIGVALVVLMLLIGIHRIFRAAIRTRHSYAHWVALGFGCVFAVQTLYMIGAGFGSWPLTGMTLAPLASGKAAAGLTLLMVLVVLAASSEPSRSLDADRRVRSRMVAWGFAACMGLTLYSGAKLVRAVVLNRDSTALHSVDGVPNRRILAETDTLRTGKILARKTGAGFDKGNLTSLAYSQRSESGKETRHYPLGTPSFPVVGIRTAYHVTGGEDDWRGQLTGLYDYMDRSQIPLPTKALEAHLLLDLWRKQRHPLWPRQEKIEPQDVQTTIAADMQTLAYETLKAHLQNTKARTSPRVRKGAMLLVDVRTGEVLAYAQYPSPNPEAMSESWEIWDQAARDPNGFLDTNGNLIDMVRHTDRAPGSTAKINTMMALSEAGLANRAFICAPGCVVNGQPIRDHDNGNHGRVGMREILKVSCNRGAAQAAQAMGSDALLAQYERLRYSLPHMARPRQTFRGYYQQIAFGQSMSASLWEMARSVAAVARGGEAIELHLLRKKPELVERWRVCSPETAARVADGMKAVTEPGGTAWSVYRGRHDWPSKTGSAQITGATETDSWFVGYAPRQKPALAFVVWAEEDGTGSGLAQAIHLPDVIEKGLKSMGIVENEAPASRRTVQRREERPRWGDRLLGNPALNRFLPQEKTQKARDFLNSLQDRAEGVQKGIGQLQEGARQVRDWKERFDKG